jgi:MOSC domain-containing protein YiiM
MPTTRELLNHLPQVGRVEWIGLAPSRMAPLTVVSEATADIGSGLRGDHHARRGRPSKREVTLIQAEHLPVVAALCGCGAAVTPDLLRRNIVVSGINLLALKGRMFQIGAVVLQFTGPCEPCSRMEQALGPGGFQAMRGHGGVTARVVTGGLIRCGDRVAALSGTNGPAGP